MITRAKNNYNKVYILKDLCKKSDWLKCEVERVKIYDGLMVHAGRIVIAYCSCFCGTLQYEKFRGDESKFNYLLTNGLSIDPLEFV